jgi:hypothetical protein
MLWAVFMADGLCSCIRTGEVAISFKLDTSDIKATKSFIRFGISKRASKTQAEIDSCLISGDDAQRRVSVFLFVFFFLSST